VSIGLPNAGAGTIEQRLTFVGKEEGKLLAFRQLIQAGLNPPVLVFLQSKERAKELYNELVFDGINVDIVHADRSAEQRDAVIRKFRLGKVRKIRIRPHSCCAFLCMRCDNFRTHCLS
jgi:ATP-dependent RNA helicase DDX52/ROK1